MSRTAVAITTEPDRSAATWRRLLTPFDRLEFVVSDAARGIASAVTAVAASRRADDPAAPPPEHGLDLFHTAREAGRVLARLWRRAEAAWARAEAADAAVTRDQAVGIDARGPAATARVAWSRAVAAFHEADRRESAWRRLRSAFEVVTPAGRLHDRATASATIAAALAELPGPEWSKVRHLASDRRALAFLDRLHRRLEAAEPRRDWREAMTWRWLVRHRHRRRPLDLAGAVAASRALNDEERASYARVAAALEDVPRSSSAVEGLNSILRMHQARHRRLPQSLLDLKRLSWNTHRFAAGPRKGTTPYQALGLALPSFDFWTLLHTDPAELRPKLSTA